MKKILIFMTAIAAAFSLTVSCNDLSEIEERVDSLESRIQALETICASLNSNVASLQEFTDNNKSISKIEEKDGVYTLTLSDGNDIVLNQGSEGTAVMPEITIGENGNWFVEGKDLGVPATGADGKTPVFGVDAEGYWTVKYAESDTPKQVLGADGQPVKAIPDGTVPGESSDQFFEDVKVENGKVTIVLKNGGGTYSLPVIPDFICAIKNAETEPVMFDYGDTKTFPVEQKNVVSATIFTPKGWEAALAENILTVIAPAAAQPATKVSADTRQDVSILAISDGGFAAITKIRVQLNDAPIVQTPTASIATGAATDKSLTFTVSVSNTTAWYYMLKPASETAPTAADLKAATQGTDTGLTLDKDAEGKALTAETEYILYVLPVSGETDGDIAKATLSTTEKVYASLYDKFIEKGSLTIGGKEYLKSDYTDEQIVKVTEGTVQAKDGNIYFISGGLEIQSIANTNVILIGEDTDNKPVYNMTASKYLTPKTGITSRMIMHNIKIDASTFANYMFTVNANYDTAGAFGEFVLVGCDINVGTKAFYSISNKRYLDRFVMENCNVNIPSGNSNKYILHTDKYESVFSEITFKNNIFYCPENSVESFRLLSGNVNAGENKTTVKKLDVQNNTFVNTNPNNGALLISNEVSKATIKNNLLHIDQAATKGGSILFCVSETYPTDRDCCNNIVYDSNGKTFNMYYAAGNVPEYNAETEQIVSLTESPLANINYTDCIFTQKAEYAAYGAQR